MTPYEPAYWKADPIMDDMVYPQVEGRALVSPAESEKNYVRRLKSVRERLAGQDLEQLLAQARSQG